MAGVSSRIRHEKLLWQPCGEPAARGRGHLTRKKSSASPRSSLNKITTFAAGTRYWRGTRYTDRRTPSALADECQAGLLGCCRGPVGNEFIMNLDKILIARQRHLLWISPTNIERQFHLTKFRHEFP